MDKSEQELLAALAMVQWPENHEPFYRLYYRQDGTPVCYSMEQWPYNYIDVDPQVFWTANMNVRVVDGVLKYIIVNHAQKLSPNGQGTACHPNNVSLVVTDDRPNQRWSIKKNETY